MSKYEARGCWLFEDGQEIAEFKYAEDAQRIAAALNAQAGVVEALEELYMAAVNVDLMGEFRERFPRKRAALRAALDKIKPLLPEPPKGESP